MRNDLGGPCDEFFVDLYSRPCVLGRWAIREDCVQPPPFDGNVVAQRLADFGHFGNLHTDAVGKLLLQGKLFFFVSIDFDEFLPLWVAASVERWWKLARILEGNEYGSAVDSNYVSVFVD